MNRILMLLMCVSTMLFSTACSSKLMQTVETPPVAQALPEGMASVTFFRSSSFGGMVQAPIAVQAKDVKESFSFVGVSSTDTKIRHTVAAGEHLYVVGGEDGMMLRAILEPQKNYYVRIEPRPGFWKARFAFVPISNIDVLSEDVQEELKDCDLVVTSPEANAWFMENKASMQTKLSEAHIEKDEAILPAVYGVDGVY